MKELEVDRGKCVGVVGRIGRHGFGDDEQGLSVSNGKRDQEQRIVVGTEEWPGHK